MITPYQYPSLAIKNAKEKLYQFGKVVNSKNWQGVESPDDTWELLNHSFAFVIPKAGAELVEEVRPNLEWASMHFRERISGEPLNPPPSHVKWPYNQEGNKKFMPGDIFSHTYPERFWPKKANYSESKYHVRKGIRYELGDARDVIELIYKDPDTRQAFLPIWFPEDTGATSGQRVPCSLGYHFIQREGFLHTNYYMRSCDIIRHFRDDIYLGTYLTYWILQQQRNKAKKSDDFWYGVKPGIFTMHITSLHCFNKEKEVLKYDKT